MKKLPLVTSLLFTAGVPLVRVYLDRRQRRSRLQAVTDTALERATGLGGSARDALTALLDSTPTPHELDARQRAAAEAGLAGRAGAAVAALPRLVGQFQDGAGLTSRRTDDWRDYGKVFR